MKKRYTGVIGIVVKRGKIDKFLLIDNIRTGNVTFPAGTLEKGEDTDETIKREVREETGLKEEGYRLVKTNMDYEFTYGNKKKDMEGKSGRQKVYILETKKADTKPTDKNIRIKGWFSKEEVIELLTFDEMRELFKEVLRTSIFRQ